MTAAMPSSFAQASFNQTAPPCCCCSLVLLDGDVFLEWHSYNPHITSSKQNQWLLESVSFPPIAKPFIKRNQCDWWKRSVSNNGPFQRGKQKDAIFCIHETQCSSFTSHN